MIPPHVRDYLLALSDDDSARVLGWRGMPLDALGGVGCEASEDVAVELAVVRDMVGRELVR